MPVLGRQEVGEEAGSGRALLAIMGEAEGITEVLVVAASWAQGRLIKKISRLSINRHGRNLPPQSFIT